MQLMKTNVLTAKIRFSHDVAHFVSSTVNDDAEFHYSLFDLNHCHWPPESNNQHHLSLVVRKPAFCKCENKGADQLRGNRAADQRLCFCYIGSTVPLLS